MSRKKPVLKKNSQQTIQNTTILLKKTIEKPIFFRELFRQAMHFLLGFLCITILVTTSLYFFRWFIVILLGAGIILSLISRYWKNPLLLSILRLVQRPSEKIEGQGAFLFLVGVGVPAFIFSSAYPVLVGLIALTFQDSVSTLAGVRFGRTKLSENKTLEGALGGFISCTIGLSTIMPLPNALLVSLIATTAEILPVNDSLSIPIFSAAISALL